MITGFLLFASGMYLRWIIGGRAPWSNMYESLLAIGATLVLISAIYELIKRDKIFGLAGSLMGGVILWLAHYASLDRGINPLVPALQSYWLIYHVIIILASYGCFAVAMVIGHFLLVQAVKSKGEMTPQLATMSKANLHVMQVGSLLLIFGILLGAVWAEVSWGRFWGWDPKETWALISWFVYIALLHGSSAGWLNWKGSRLCLRCRLSRRRHDLLRSEFLSLRLAQLRRRLLTRNSVGSLRLSRFGRRIPHMDRHET
jgi:cytochrome c-type biogenesis protein CcsB